MIVLDLFCGYGGFSQTFRDRGHQVTGIDIIPPADIIADVHHLPLSPNYRPDLIIGSPPCTEFTKFDLPWRDCPKPSFDLVNAFLRAVDTYKPTFWAMENVRGLKRLWDQQPVMRVGSRYLWGNFPLFLFGAHQQAHGKWKLPPSKNRARLRSKIPAVISQGLCRSVEAALGTA
jgi:hypothetical protein